MLPYIDATFFTILNPGFKAAMGLFMFSKASCLQ